MRIQRLIPLTLVGFLLTILSLGNSGCSLLTAIAGPPGSSGELTQLAGLRSFLYQLQDAEIDPIIASGFKLVVIDYSRDGSDAGRYTSGEIGRLRAQGIVPLAYLSIGEAEDYRFYWQERWDADHDGVPDPDAPAWLGRSNPDWGGNYKVKYWDPAWQRIIFEYLDKIIAQGFAGVYLDIIDAFEYWSDPDNQENTVLSEATAAQRMIAFVEKIARYARARVPGFLVFPQNGERILDYDTTGSFLNTISGFGIEDLFYNGLERNPSELIAERTAYLDRVTAAGRIILSVDYVDDGHGYRGANKARIDDYLTRARARRYLAYAARADRELDILNVIPGVQP